MIQTAVCTDKIVFEGVRNFSPALTFDCGQCFRFDVLADGSAEGTVGREHAKSPSTAIRSQLTAGRTENSGGGFSASTRITTP